MAESGPLKVFLVEDNEIYLKTLEFHLNKKFGDRIAVSSFLSGEACMEKIEENPDIIVLDFNLDSEDENAMDGLATLKAARAAIPSVTITMLSSQSSYGTAAKTIASGAVNYIIKDDKAADSLADFIESKM